MTIRAAVPRLSLLLALATLVAWSSVHRAFPHPSSLQHQMQSMGPWAPLAFIALFAVATVVFLPGALFGLAGGALFGPVWGTLWNLAGAMLGATLAFLAARYIAGDWVAGRAGGRLKALLDVGASWRSSGWYRYFPSICSTTRLA